MEVQVSIGELKRDLSGIINQAAYGKERIVIVSRGKPKAAMISLEDLEQLRRISHYGQEPQAAWLARADALREGNGKPLTASNPGTRRKSWSN